MTSCYRAVWLSDIHLGNKDCKADYLLAFLESSKIDMLYLVGDVVDMWAMSKQFRWPESHNKVLQKLLSLSQQGCKVVYLPGNHDEPLQKYSGMGFGDVQIEREYVHVTAQNKKLLIMHGDQFDQEVCLGQFHSWVGDKGYMLLMFLNRHYNKIRACLGFPYWSLAGYIKSRINGANKAIARYRDACCRYARKAKVDGIVCGHIHHPEMMKINGIDYYNDGDWVENCTALAESHTGELSLVYWMDVEASQTVTPIKPVSLWQWSRKRAA